MSDITRSIMKAIEDSHQFDLILTDVAKGLGNCGFFQLANWEDIVASNLNANVYAKESLKLIEKAIANKDKVDFFQVLNNVAQQFTTPGFFFKPDYDNTIHIASNLSDNSIITFNSLEQMQGFLNNSTGNIDVSVEVGEIQTKISDSLDEQNQIIVLPASESNSSTSSNFSTSSTNGNEVNKKSKQSFTSLRKPLVEARRKRKRPLSLTASDPLETCEVNKDTQRESMIVDMNQVQTAEEKFTEITAIDNEKFNNDLLIHNGITIDLTRNNFINPIRRGRPHRQASQVKFLKKNIYIDGQRMSNGALKN